jgi:AcrR family transcriptional regulator
VEQVKPVREPRQKRSVETKNKVLDAAYKLFCDKGYFNTTTNEIAKVAGVNIGSLYSYFQDQETILLEVVNRFNASFLETIDEIYQDTELCKEDVKLWLRRLMDNMIRAYQDSKEFNRELNALSYSMPKIAAIMENQHKQIHQIAIDFVEHHQKSPRIQDVEAASIITYSLIESVVNQIVFEKNTIDRERILQAAIDAIYAFLIV